MCIRDRACPESSRRARSDNMHHLVQIWFQWVEQWGYVGIILLMAMESSIFPVPSEIVIPPAAFLASEGKLNTFGVIAAGTFGSWLGATATYWAASVSYTHLRAHETPEHLVC